MPLPPLIAELKAQTGQFLTKMGEAKAELRSVENEGNKRGAALKGALQKHFTDAGNSASGLTGQIGKLATGLTEMSPAAMAAGGAAVAAAAGVAALVAAGIGKFESQAAEVRKLKAALGSTAEEASGMRNVAVGLGIDVDALSKGVFKLSSNLVKTGGDFAGVHVETARNRDGTANLVGTVDNLRAAYQSIQDPQQKNVFLQEALSKGGLQLRGVLSATNEEYAKLKAHGPIYSDKDLSSARELGIANRELGQSVSKLETDLARGVIPLLTQLSTVTATAVDWADRHVTVTHALGNALVEGLKNVTPLGPALNLLGIGHKNAGSAAEEAKAKFAEESAALADMGVELDSAEKDESSLTKEHKAAVAEAEKYRAKIDEMGAAVTAASLMMGTAADQLSSKQRDEAKAFDAARDSADHLKQGLDILIGVHLSATQAAIGWEQKLHDTRDALRENRATLDISTEAGRKNQTAIIDMIQAGLGHIDALQREGASSEQVTAAYSDHVAALRSVMQQAGFTESQISDLLNQYNLLHDAPNIYHSITTEYLTIGSSGKTASQLGYTGYATGGKIGEIPRAARGLQGFRTNGPTLVGEGNPLYPEYVIATDPAYRDRNLKLLAQVTAALGGSAMASGGSPAAAVGGNATYNVNVQIVAPTGDIPESTMRQFRRQIFAMLNDMPPGSILPGAT